MKPFGGGGVHLGQAAVERAGSRPFFLFEAPAEQRIGRGALESAAEQALQIERCSADEKHFLAPPADAGNTCLGGRQVLGEAELPVGFDNVNQMVGRCRTLLGGRLGGANVHSPVDRHRVERNDFGPQKRGKGDADLRFSARGWTSQKPAPGCSKALHGAAAFQPTCTSW